MQTQERAEISVIIPTYNEEGNVSVLVERIFPAMAETGRSFEIIFVNDGSTDGTLAELLRLAACHPEVKVVDFRRNYGQTAAMMAGIDHAVGGILVTLDADLQNDPADIPAMLRKLDEGYDVVSGWRVDRKDGFSRNLVSRIANHMISAISGVRLNDFGCTLKIYRAEVVRGYRLYGEMHRFIAIYASWMGARVVEMPVRHHSRSRGQSKYGFGRVVKVLLDLLVVKFLDRHFVKPIYVFGGFGILSLILCILSTTYMFYIRIAKGIFMIQTPLALISVMTFLVSVMSILMGLLAEMLVRTYFESQGRAAYEVRRVANLGRAVPSIARPVEWPEPVANPSGDR